MTSKKKSTPDTMCISTPGERLRYIRALVNFDRVSFARESGIPEVTIRRWESGVRNITKKGIERCIAAYHEIGMAVSGEWLEYGIGAGPDIEIGEGGHSLVDLRLLNEKSPTFFSYLDRECRFQFVSSRYSRIFNMPVSQVLGKRLPELIGEEAFKKQEPYLHRAFQGKEVKFEYFWQHEEREGMYIELNFVPHTGKNKVVKGLFSFLNESSASPPQGRGDTPPWRKLCIGDILPWVHDDDLSYDHALYLQVLEAVRQVLDSYNLAYGFEEVAKTTANVYAHALGNNRKICMEYLERLVDIAIRAGILSCS